MSVKDELAAAKRHMLLQKQHHQTSRELWDRGPPPLPPQPATPASRRKRATIVVIPDSHAEPGTDNRRFTWLSHLIADTEPTHVVHLGDHFDLAAAGRYDRGTAAGEGQRVQEDLVVGADSLKLIQSQVPPSLLKKIKWHFLFGNHEDRLDAFAFEHPEWRGIIGTHLLPLDGWQRHGFNKKLEINGVYFSHFFPSGVMNRPIASARVALLRLHHSAVWGHLHTFDYATSSSHITGLETHALNAGCFFEHHHEFAGPANLLYWRGVHILHDTLDGDYDLERVSLKRLERMYR